MKEFKILLVDDDPEDRDIIKDAMALHNADDIIHFAENGEQALNILDYFLNENQVPCLVVLDLNMPKMNGTETLRHLKNHERFKEIPVVIYTTSINSLEKEKCIQLGAQDFFTKPISFNESKETALKLLSFCK